MRAMAKQVSPSARGTSLKFADGTWPVATSASYGVISVLLGEPSALIVAKGNTRARRVIGVAHGLGRGGGRTHQLRAEAGEITTVARHGADVLVAAGTVLVEAERVVDHFFPEALVRAAVARPRPRDRRGDRPVVL